MDFITGLLKSQGFEVILLVVDQLSKYAHSLQKISDFVAVILYHYGGYKLPLRCTMAVSKPPQR